jgi:hypothetical protein
MSLKTYRETAERNSAIFEQNCAVESRLFEDFDQELTDIIVHLNSRCELMTVEQRVSSSFLALIHRQFRSGFELYRRRLSADGDAVIRVAIECLCHFHKLIIHQELLKAFFSKQSGALELTEDERELLNKQQEKEFNRTFQFAALFAKDLPHRDRLKAIRDRINEGSAHPDHFYLAQTIERVGPLELHIHYTDYLNDVFQLKLLQFLDCYWHIIDAIRSILNGLGYLSLGMQSSNANWEKTSRKMARYKTHHRQWSTQFLKSEGSVIDVNDGQTTSAVNS